MQKGKNKMVELVIKIDENFYKTIKDNKSNLYGGRVYEMIRKGIPLPKEHGDLVDRDSINCRFYDIGKELESYSNKPTYKELLDKLSMCLDTALPIIEAESEDIIC